MVSLESTTKLSLPRSFPPSSVRVDEKKFGEKKSDEDFRVAAIPKIPSKQHSS